MRKAALIISVGMVLVSLRSVAQSGPPKLCKPCLFYGGDYDSTNQNSEALEDENTVIYKSTSTYAPLTVPRGHAILVEGILFQIQFIGAAILDPKGVTWEIRSGVTGGGGGHLIASGSGAVAMEPTGRAGAGFEYSVRVKVPTVELDGGNKGTTYWFNLTPQCTNSHDLVCSTIQYAVSNTALQANNFRGELQPIDRLFINSAFYHWNWAWWCDLGLNGNQCGYASYGLIGNVLY